MDVAIDVIISIIAAATPLLFAALGELVTEKSGVLNLGVEGMMIMGAVCAFVVGVSTGSLALAVICGALAGGVVAFLFGVLTLSVLANQVATGLALTIFGVGLSALVGRDFVGMPVERLAPIFPEALREIPIVGRLIFGHDVLVYISLLLVLLVAWFLYRTRAGLILRATGESHDAAHAIGYSVLRVRYLAVVFGGLCSGLGGAYLSLAYTPMWVESMTAGRGWIALALVVFATWKPGRALLGAYLFGGITILQLHLQGFGIGIPSQLLSMLPYIATIAVLVVISRDTMRVRLNAPASLGRAFHPDR